MNDAPGAGRITLAGELDDQPAAALNLHHGLLRAELVHAGADNALRALDRVGAIGDRSLRLVHLEREVNAALQIEPQVDRHPAHDRVLHRAGRRVADALRRIARHQRDDAEEDQDPDDVQPLPNLPHRLSLPVEGRPRRLAVALELRHQRIAGRERLHIAQATDPFHVYGLPVQLAGEIEQMDFERASLVTKCRPGALVHHASQDPGS